MSRKIIISLIITQAVLTAGQFILTLGRATDGDRIFDLQAQIDELSKTNSQLSEQIFQQTSVSQLKEYALSKGYVPQTIVGLDPLSVAARIEVP